MSSYRAGWCLTLLNNAGLVENPNRGRWKISSRALEMTPGDLHSLVVSTAKNMQSKALKKSRSKIQYTCSIHKNKVNKTSSSPHDVSPIEDIKKLMELLGKDLISSDSALSGIRKILKDNNND